MCLSSWSGLKNLTTTGTSVVWFFFSKEIQDINTLISSKSDFCELIYYTFIKKCSQRLKDLNFFSMSTQNSYKHLRRSFKYSTGILKILLNCIFKLRILVTSCWSACIFTPSTDLICSVIFVLVCSCQWRQKSLSFSRNLIGFSIPGGRKVRLGAGLFAGMFFN